jgi:hypothetical protein
VCRELAKDFVVAGSASESLYGACESMFKPDMVSHQVYFVLFLMRSLSLLIKNKHP